MPLVMSSLVPDAPPSSSPPHPAANRALILCRLATKTKDEEEELNPDDPNAQFHVAEKDPEETKRQKEEEQERLKMLRDFKVTPVCLWATSLVYLGVFTETPFISYPEFYGQPGEKGVSEI